MHGVGEGRGMLGAQTWSHPGAPRGTCRPSKHTGTQCTAMYEHSTTTHCTPTPHSCPPPPGRVPGTDTWRGGCGRGAAGEGRGPHQGRAAQAPARLAAARVGAVGHTHRHPCTPAGPGCGCSGMDAGDRGLGGGGGRGYRTMGIGQPGSYACGAGGTAEARGCTWLAWSALAAMGG